MTHSTHERPQTKKCAQCGEVKPLGEYQRHVNMADGLRSKCKACRVVESRAYYVANKERKAETGRAWYEANRERHAEAGRAWRGANRERVVETRRAAIARYRAKHPEREAARSAVSNAVRAGKLPAASTQVCVACGGDAQNWHHHQGYEPEHWLDVIAVCVPCHAKLEWGEI